MSSESQPGIRLSIGAEWNVTVARAVAMQAEMASSVSLTCAADTFRTVAGVDAAFRNGVVRAAAVVISLPEIKTLASETVEMETNFPYLPGLLSFREGSAVLEAIQRLDCRPDVLVFDWHGFAHPRRFGIASHIGVLLDSAAIGCAKTNLFVFNDCYCKGGFETRRQG